MNWKIKVFIAVVAVVTVVNFAGCTSKIPILLYKEKAVENPNRLSLTAGVTQTKFLQKDNLVDISTYIFPLQSIKGGFPKVNEKEFVADSVVQYCRDTNLFNFTYHYPFDIRDIDILVDITIEKIKFSNNSLYAGIIINVPYLNLLTLFGVPQEIYSAELKMKFDIKTPDGAIIATYAFSDKKSDAVSLYTQPWSGYLWYHSVHRTVFLGIMDQFKAKVEEDSAIIVKKAQEYETRHGG